MSRPHTCYASPGFLSEVRDCLFAWESYAPFTSAERAVAARFNHDVQGDARSAAQVIHTDRKAAAVAAADKRAADRKAAQ